METRNQWQAEDIQLVVWCVPWYKSGLEAIVGVKTRWRFDNHNNIRAKRFSAFTVHKIEMST